MSEALQKVARHLNLGEMSDALTEQMVEMPETDDARVLKKGKMSPMRKETSVTERVLSAVSSRVSRKDWRRSIHVG